MALRLTDVSYTYKPGTPYTQTALECVSLEVKQGEFTAIIGATGSGKSTLIQHFNGLLQPTRGQVAVFGRSLQEKKNLRWARQKVGLVFQYPEHQLFEETVYSDVAYGVRNAGLSEKQVEARVRRALGMVGLDWKEVKDRSPFAFSGGQMRRIAIAGVLAMQPEVIVLDEPTAGLDPKGRKEITEQVSRLHKEQGLTVVLVSHNMEDVARLAQKVVVMHQGKIVLQGPPREVFSRGEELTGWGLGLPQVTQVLMGLKQAGAQVKNELVTVDDAKQEIMRLLRSKGHAQ